VKMLGVGNNSAFYLTDKDGRVWILEWNAKKGGHVIRVPHHLWHDRNEAVAHSLMEQNPRVSFVVSCELSPEVAAFLAELKQASEQQEEEKQQEESPEMGATAANNEAGIMVGPGDETAVAPTLDAVRPAEEVQPQSEASGPVEAPEAPAANADSQLPAPADQPTTASEVIQTPEAPTVPAASPAPEPLHMRAYDAVEKPIRVKPLAEKLGVTEEALRAAIELPDSKLEIAAAGWVKRKD
jgi:hypothetical protein